jgi:hypothetical protein
LSEDNTGEPQTSVLAESALLKTVMFALLTGSLNDAISVGRLACTTPAVAAGLLLTVIVNAAADAWPRSGEATVANVAKATVNVDRRINAEVIWGSPFRVLFARCNEVRGKQ